MSDQPDPALVLDAAHYSEMQARLRQLKSRLPETSVKLLALEVIHRLADDLGPDTIQMPRSDRIEALCHALLSEDDEAGARFIHEVQTQGATFESIYLNYLAAAARMLGTWWEEDGVSFVQVTVATSRMYALMRALRREMPMKSVAPNKSAVFASVPGEAHILGVRMAADLFQRDGWDIDLKIGKSHDELVAETAGALIIVIGLSPSDDRALDALSRLVIAMRINAPQASIFISGTAVTNHRELIELMDVDGMADDLQAAKDMLDAFVARNWPEV
jgi:methanogenic corrinoid protein MtbC1